MDKKQFIALYNSVKLSITFEGQNFEHQWKKVVEKRYGAKLLDNESLIEAIKQLKEFDINKLWEPSFWGLKQHESICAVATEIYQNLKRIRLMVA